MSEPEHDPILDRLRRGAQIVAPPDLQRRILERARPEPITAKHAMAAFTFGCACFVFTAVLVDRICPGKTAASAPLEQAVDASFALTLPWFATGRLDTSVAHELESRPELLLLEEARLLRVAADREEPPR